VQRASVYTSTRIPSRAEARTTGVGLFLAFGAFMAALAGTTLVWRGTALDRLWALNEPAYIQLSRAGSVVGALFLLVLSAALACTAVDWFKCCLWGWRLAVGIISTQIAGDIVNFLRGDFLRAGTGLAIAGALLFYLFRPGIRGTFH
jgi:hypothetical protein